MVTKSIASRISIFMLLFSILSISAYADDCAALGGSIVGAECQISSNVNRLGSYTLDETLHILASKTINASSNSNVGIDLTIKGDLLMDVGSRINANDNGTGNEAASPITLDIQDNLEMNDKSGIFAENRKSGGDGGNIEITTGGNILMKSGSNISSSDRAGGTPGGQPVAGDITIKSGGNFDMETNTVIAAANDAGGKAGNIYVEADGKVNIEGLVSVGPSTDVLDTKYSEYILDRAHTHQQGGTITIISNSLSEPGIKVGSNAILVSQGEDPGSDKILLEGCGIEVNGLIGSVAQKSHTDDAVPGIITLRSGTTININGQDLGAIGSSQARIRADDVEGELPKPRRVDIFANGKITVNGAPINNQENFTVTSNGGSKTNQFGGTIRVISLLDQIVASDNAFAAQASHAGGDGGKINLSSKSSSLIDFTRMNATGDAVPQGGLGNGGKISVRSYSDSLSWMFGAGDARPISTGGAVNLTACTTVDYTGSLFANLSAPGVLTGLCSPSAPSLPPGEGPLPICEPTNEIPEFTTIGAALVLAGAGFYMYRKRKK